jgi:hypothetical protein
VLRVGGNRNRQELQIEFYDYIEFSMELVFGGWKSFGFNGQGGDDEGDGGFKAIGLNGLRGAARTHSSGGP